MLISPFGGPVGCRAASARRCHHSEGALLYHAWVDSSGTKFVRTDDYPGWLRAHEIVERHRFARPQERSFPVGQSGCVLRKGASRCP